MTYVGLNAGGSSHSSNRILMPRGKGSRFPTFYRRIKPVGWWDNLQESVITYLIDMARRAGVGMRELPYYLQPSNLGHLAIRMALNGASHYTADLLRGRTNKAEGLEAVLAGTEESPQQQPQSPYR